MPINQGRVQRSDCARGRGGSEKIRGLWQSLIQGTYWDRERRSLVNAELMGPKDGLNIVLREEMFGS